MLYKCIEKQLAKQEERKDTSLHTMKNRDHIISLKIMSKV